MMKPFDDVADGLTRRLSPDPELRAEVAAELQSHLESSARDFLAAGRSEDDAWADAVRALGDQREVSDSLFYANERRMSRRRAARWLVGTTLVATAGAGSVTLAWGALLSVAVLLAMIAGNQPWSPAAGLGHTAAQRLAAHARATAIAAVAPKDVPLFPTEEKVTPLGQLESARLLAERTQPGDPDHVTYWAHYAAQAINVADYHDRYGHLLYPGSVDRAPSVLDQCRHIEPDNGFYPLASAALLLQFSASYIEEPEDKLPGFPYTTRDGRPDRMTFDRFSFSDPASRDRAFSLLHDAAGAQYIDAHVTDFTRRRLDALPTPTRLADLALRAQEEAARLLPHLNILRHAFNATGARAIELASQGQAPEALSLIHDERTAAQLFATRAQTIIEGMIAVGPYQTTLGHEAIVLRDSHDDAGYRHAVSTLESVYRHAGGEPPNWPAVFQVKRTSGLLSNLFLSSSADPDKLDPAPERRAEYAVADQLASTTFAGLLALSILPLALTSLYSRLRTGHWPAFVLVPLPSLARILLLSVALPLLLYTLYCLSPLGGRHLGIAISTDRLAVEYASLSAIILLLLARRSTAPLLRRAHALNQPWQPVSWSPARKLTGLLLSLATLAYFITWRQLASTTTDYDSAPTGQFGFLLAGLLLAFALTTPTLASPSPPARRLPHWVLPVSLTTLFTLAMYVIGTNFGYRTGRLISEISQSAFAGIALLTAAVLTLRLIFTRRSPRSATPLNPRLSLGPILLAAALTLLCCAALPARLLERHAVATVHSTGGIVRLDHELDQSRYRTLRNLALTGTSL